MPADVAAPRSLFRVLPGLLGLLALAGVSAAAVKPLPAVVEFNRDIRPIMSNTCFKCHGGDVAGNKGDLRLDRPESAYAPITDKSGRTRTPIIPGDPENSEVWRRLISKEAAEVMPPPDTLHQLSERDIALVKRWIEQGAKYEAHWSYVVPQKRPLPAVAPAQAALVRTPVDAFVLDRLATESFTPSPEADRATLLRRLSLDLTGLPPTTAEVAAFVADGAPDAYERLVDRLLASPHYGERMAVPWLDLVRFADSVGFHGDQLQNVFPYRDYVIDAFNANKPFDQFTREQLAGDLLPNPTPAQLVATGFNRLNMMTREGGAQPKEYLAKYAADRVRAVSTAWMGSTMACAECHDHKYDPISARDFYATAAYFADIKQWGVYHDYTYTPEPELRNFTNDHPFPPELQVTSDYLERRRDRITARLEQFIASSAPGLTADAERWPALDAWVAQAATVLQAEPTRGWRLARPDVAADDPQVEALADGSARFSVPATGRGAARSPLPVVALAVPGESIAAIRVEVLPDEQHQGKVGRGGRDLFNTRVTFAIRPAGEGALRPVEVFNGYTEQANESYSNGQRLPAVTTGWRSFTALAEQPQAAVFLLKTPVTLAAGERLVATFGRSSVAVAGSMNDPGRVRVMVSPLAGRLPGDAVPAAVREALLATAPTDDQKALRAGEYLRSTGAGDAEAQAAIQRELHAIAECFDGKAWTAVTAATTPATTRILPRGNWLDETGEVVRPAPPGFLSGGDLPADAPRQTRLDLANWIVSRDNPLTARALVNRLWEQFFGTGLSAVLDDLGAQGEWPSHPELLDWLAVEFMDRGWDVKAMVRLIVTSSTYRQSSRARPELLAADPANRLLARQNARRLEAEFVRDNALAIAGLIDREVGGPSARPYQPEGYYASLNFPIRDYETQVDDRQYRRGVYQHWQRTFLHPMLANFDAPSREECVAERAISSTPQQALTLLNDPTFVEAARGLALQILAARPAGTVDERIAEGVRRVVAREPNEREAASLRAFHVAQWEHYQANPEEAEAFTRVGLLPVPGGTDRVELAAWTSVSRVLLNLNETIVRY